MPVKSALTREPKLHTYEEMNALLAKRTAQMQEKVHVQPQPVEQPDGRDQPRTDELAWLEQAIDLKTGRKLPYVITTCGRYTVDAARMPGSQFRFSAWRRSETPGIPAEALGCCDTGADAKALCAAHALNVERAKEVNS